MEITVTITKTLEEFWATDDELRTMSDAEILELIQEDISAFVENAQWAVSR